MPYNLSLPSPLPNDGWKVKILDNELEFEEPHLTIRRGTKHWRMSLRDGEFMDKNPAPRDVADEVVAAIEADWKLLVKEWNDRHPSNPV